MTINATNDAGEYCEVTAREHSWDHQHVTLRICTVNSTERLVSELSLRPQDAIILGHALVQYGERVKNDPKQNPNYEYRY